MVHPHGAFDIERENWWKNSKTWLWAAAGGFVLAASVIAITDAKNSSHKVGGETTATVTFDDKGVGSNVIMVYPGVTRDKHDMNYNGTFLDEQTAIADCQISGRTVPQPDDGVEHSVVERSTWMHLKGHPSSFAVALYFKNGLEIAGTLEPCR